MNTWVPSEAGAFIYNPTLGSVYAKLPTAPGDFQGETAAMFNTPLGPNHFVQATIAAIGPPTPNVISDCGIATRMSIDPITGLISAYLFFLRHDGGVDLAFEVNVRPGQGFGAQTDFQRTDIPGVSSRFDVPYHVGSVMRMEVVDNLITCLMDGVVVYGPISGDIPGTPFGVERLVAPNVGVEAYPATEPLSSRFQLSNILCGTLPSGSVIAPSLFDIGVLEKHDLPTSSIEEALRTKLLDNAAVAALVGDRIMPSPAQHQLATPFVTYQLISSPETGELDGTPDFATHRVQLACVADDWGMARRVLDAVRAVALDPNTRGTWNGIVVDSIFVVDKRDMGIDEDTGFFRHDLDLEIWQQLS